MRVLISTTTDPEPIARALASTGRHAPLVTYADDQFAKLVGEADALIVGNAKADLHRSEIEAHAHHLRWIQFSSAGFDALNRIRLPRGVVVSRSIGVWSLPVAEHALALSLALLRGLHKGHSVRHADVRSMSGLSVIVVGHGEIGRIFARHAAALGATVRPVARSPRKEIGAQILGIDQLPRLLPDAQLVVLCAPEQADGAPILDRSAIDLLPAGALVVNVGRGKTIDEEALGDALTRGQIGGAGLDVFATEPLPATSPLHRIRNVILTPHSAGHGDPGSLDRLAKLCTENASRLLSGQRLLGQVTKHDGPLAANSSTME